MRKLLLLFLVVCLLGGGALVAAEGADRSGADVPGVALPDPGRTADRIVDRVTRSDDTTLTPATCPSDGQGCRSVTGRIVFVERVDPDGDGDLHVVIADGGITAPGLTSVDVRPGLRPERDPAIGDRATAAGPVQTGSKGQAQIHALRFRVG